MCDCSVFILRTEIKILPNIFQVRLSIYIQPQKDLFVAFFCPFRRGNLPDRERQGEERNVA